MLQAADRGGSAVDKDTRSLILELEKRLATAERRVDLSSVPRSHRPTRIHHGTVGTVTPRHRCTRAKEEAQRVADVPWTW